MKKIILTLVVIYIVLILPTLVCAIEQREWSDHPITDFNQLPINVYFQGNYPNYANLGAFLLFGGYDEN